MDDKENSVLDEEDEDEDGTEDGTEGEGDGSEVGTERRTSRSYSVTDLGTEAETGSLSYGSASTVSERRVSSFATSTVGTVGEGYADSVVDGEGSEVDADADADADAGSRLAVQGTVNNACEMVVFGHPSDSGIGTDVPTAALLGPGGRSEDGGYFR